MSYLGLGVQPPLPSWGLMISEGQSYLEMNPWLSVIPGMALFMLVAGVQFLTQSITAEGAEERELAVKPRHDRRRRRHASLRPRAYGRDIGW